MDVFRISPTKPYTGGAAYVAAKNVDEAIKTFCNDDYRTFEYTEGNCTCNHVPDMSYDINIPVVIFDDLYIS